MSKYDPNVFITLKRPKYHPLTGIELDGNYQFEFNLQEDHFWFNQLVVEKNKLQNTIIDLKAQNNNLNQQNKDLLKRINQSEKENRKLKQRIQAPQKIRKYSRKLNALQRLVNTDSNTTLTPKIERDIKTVSELQTQ